MSLMTTARADDLTPLGAAATAARLVPASLKQLAGFLAVAVVCGLFLVLGEGERDLWVVWACCGLPLLYASWGGALGRLNGLMDEYRVSAVGVWVSVVFGAVVTAALMTRAAVLVATRQPGSAADGIGWLWTGLALATAAVLAACFVFLLLTLYHLPLLLGALVSCLYVFAALGCAAVPFLVIRDGAEGLVAVVGMALPVALAVLALVMWATPLQRAGQWEPGWAWAHSRS